MSPGLILGLVIGVPVGAVAVVVLLAGLIIAAYRLLVVGPSS